MDDKCTQIMLNSSENCEHRIVENDSFISTGLCIPSARKAKNIYFSLFLISGMYNIQTNKQNTQLIYRECMLNHYSYSRPGKWESTQLL